MEGESIPNIVDNTLGGTIGTTVSSKNPKRRIKIIRKILLVLLFLVLLEIGLRASGVIFLNLQERGNKIVPQSAYYPILVLTDSMGYGGDEVWPRQLETILNQQSKETKFKVFTIAVPGATSADVIKELEQNLDKYNPQMVITMMGERDIERGLGSERKNGGIISVVEDLRIYKLIKFFWPVSKKIAGEGKKELGEKRSEEQRLLHILEQEPANMEATVTLAYFYNNLRQFGQAEDILKRVLETKNISYDSYYRGLYLRGLIYEKKKEFPLAEEIFEEILTKVATVSEYNLLASIALGRVFRMQKKYEQAEDILKKTLVTYGNKAGSASLELILMYLDWKPEKAYEFYESYAVNPAQDIVLESDRYLKEGENHLFHENYIEAISALTASLIINPGNLLAHKILSFFYFRNGDYETTEEITRRIIRMNPLNDDPEVYLLLGRSLFEQDKPEKYEEAIPIFKRLFKWEGFKPPQFIIYQLGSYHQRNNQTREAVEWLERSLQMNPNDSDTLFRLAQGYLELDKNKEGAELLERVVALNDEHYDKAVFELAWFYLTVGEQEKAASLFQKVKELNPEKLAQLYSKLGNRYQQENKPQSAVLLFEKAETLRQEYFNPVTQQNYRRLYKTVKDKRIKLIAVQYPLLNVEELKSFFDQDDYLVFVSNEDDFKEGVRKEGFSEYFIDDYFGRFGHPTDKGHKIIAENVAEVILERIV